MNDDLYRELIYQMARDSKLRNETTLFANLGKEEIERPEMPSLTLTFVDVDEDTYNRLLAAFLPSMKQRIRAILDSWFSRS